MLSFHNIIPRLAPRLLKPTRAVSKYISLDLPTIDYTAVTTNGVRIATEENLSSMATISLMALAGPRYEYPAENGVTHFIEHMCFKGFSNMSREQLERKCLEDGIMLTAEATKELFIMTAKCMPTSDEFVLDVFSKVVTEMALSDSEMEAEKNNICLELIDADNNPKKVLFEYLVSSAYQGTPLAQPVIGPTQNIQAIDQNTIRSYVARSFDPNKMVVTSCGGVSHARIASIVQEKFGDISSYGCIDPCQPCRYTGSEVLYRNDDMPWAHIALAVEAPGFLHPDYLPLMVAAEVVGSWSVGLGGQFYSYNKMGGIAVPMSNENLCDTIEAFYLPFTDTGLWGVYFIADKMKVDDVIYNIQQLWVNMCLSCPQGVMDRARGMACLKLIKQLAGCNNSCMDIGKHIMHGDLCNRDSLMVRLERIRAMKAISVTEAVEKILYNQCPVVAGVGPTEGVPEYNRVRSSMYWLRF